MSNTGKGGSRAGFVSALLLTAGTVYAQAPNPIDAAALERALVPMRKEVATACGAPIDVRVDVPSFVKHKLPRGMHPIGEEDVIRMVTSFIPYIVDLCQVEPAMAKRVTGIVLRSEEAVEGGTVDTSPVYVDRRNVGSRYIVGGKAALRSFAGVYMFEAGEISVYTSPVGRFPPLFSDFTKARDRERQNFLRAIPGLGIGAGTAVNVSDGDRGKSKLGAGCVAVDGEQICGSGSLSFAEAVESGDCNQSSSPSISIDCRKRLAGVKAMAIDCKIGETYQAMVNANGNQGYVPGEFFERVLKKLPSCPNGGDLLVDVLSPRWDYNSQSLKMRLEDKERGLVEKLNKAVMAACSTLRPTVSSRRVLSPENRESTVLTEFLYRCAVVAGGSLAPYAWKTKAADIALLKKDQSERREGDVESRAEVAARRNAEAARIKNLPPASSYCKGKVKADCIVKCRQAKLCK